MRRGGTTTAAMSSQKSFHLTCTWCGLGFGVRVRVKVRVRAWVRGRVRVSLPLDVHLAVEQRARVVLLKQLALLLGQVRLHVRGAEGEHHRSAELRDRARASAVPVVVSEEVVRAIAPVLHAAAAG